MAPVAPWPFEASAGAAEAEALAAAAAVPFGRCCVPFGPDGAPPEPDADPVDVLPFFDVAVRPVTLVRTGRVSSGVSHATADPVCARDDVG
ncbi:hypothetical protein [Cellulomonas alba]|uniref:Uncharacterized protein n=1 Tax=Cellulomonas alba TaxID=3053467 RepID=A0ABT7SFR4_9CELL|nr:hypothetical protein [Cellulomonas alba]MDM7855043.1 hypothetical protein [Cellulomonas alba]